MIERLAGTVREGLLSRTAFSASHRSPQPKCSPDPRYRFFEIVDELARQDRLAFHVAMAKARDARPEEFRAAYPSRH